MYYVGKTNVSEEVFYSRKAPISGPWLFVTGPYRTRVSAHTIHHRLAPMVDIWRNCKGEIIRRELVD